jgi:myo-inositol-1(or 4)-monophosphatase
VEALRAERPADGVLGEEYGDSAVAGSAAAGPGAVRWILDPIDGTVNYLYGLPQYAVSLAAELDGEVVAGVVINAATGDEWTATTGGGAWRAGRRLSGSQRTTLDQSLVGTGFGYDSRRRAHQGQVFASLITRVRDIRRFGAASLDLCLTAEGSIDAYYEKGLNLWDHAAGGLIATEAGLIVAGLSGEPAGGRMLVAAPPALFRPLHEALVELDAAGGPWARRPRRRHSVSGSVVSVTGLRQAPGGRVGSPSAPSDWFTSVVVASCWNWLPMMMSTTSPLRFAL